MAATCVAAKVSGSASGDDEVRDLWFKASVRDPSRRDPLLHLARHALSRGDHQAAASFATAALAIPPRVGFSEPEANLREAPHAILYWALLWLGRRSEARSHFEICRRLDPSNPTYEEHAKFFY
jgi:tetratricopeptide (TPR) repeat protein